MMTLDVHKIYDTKICYFSSLSVHDLMIHMCIAKY